MNFQQAFIDELEKLAANAQTRKHLKFFNEASPGFIKAYKREMAKAKAATVGGNLIDQKFVGPVPSSTSVMAALAKSRKISSMPADFSTAFPVPAKAQYVSREREGKALRAIGRHPAKKGERFVRGRYSAEHVQDPRHRSKFMYRGSELPKDSKTIQITRHPDVAAGYAVGTSASQFTKPTGTMLEFRKKGLPRLGEGPPDNYASGSRDPESLLTGERGSKRHEAYAGVANRTYEDTIPAKALKRRRVKPTARFSVRLSRDESGNPGYALKPL